MSREGAGTRLVAEVIKGECGGYGASLSRPGRPPGAPLFRWHTAVPTELEEDPISGQEVPSTFGARASAVSWVWVAFWNS